VRPVEWLLDNAGVDQRSCVIHATHMTADERRGLAASGAVAGICPLTEANLADGRFPLAAYRHEGGRLGVGTDANQLIPALAGQTAETALDAWIFSSASEAIVRTVLVAGRAVVRDGRHPREEQARRRVGEVMRERHGGG
jgi:cytosine/adenosine deaminase-related metal-dependent hydrolase